MIFLHRETWVIIATFIIAWFLTLIPLSEGHPEWHPQWVALVFIFWILQFPDRIGIFWGFFVGLMLDVISGALLGQHALSYSIIGYLTIGLQQRLRLFRIWQQALSVWLLLTVERLFSLWIIEITGQPTPLLTYWITPGIGMLLWPMISMLLFETCRYFDIST
jgi:rod shape-determining protein MreD